MAVALLIFKPDAAYRLSVRNALWQWLTAQTSFRLDGLKWFQAPVELVQEHYGFLRERPFFPWLVDFMTALPVAVGRLSGDSPALEQLRYELGETIVQKARPGSLRERYGIYAGVNCLHVSDSAETGAQETELWSRYLSLEGVQFEADGEVTVDHTYHLRSLAMQVSEGVHQDLAGLEMRKLLKEETQLEGEELESLCRIILGALV